MKNLAASKLLVLLITIALVLTIVPTAVAETEEPDYDTIISVGKFYTTTVEQYNSVFKFIPEQTGNYKLSSQGSYSTWGYIYDRENEPVNEISDESDDINFCLYYYLIAGESYSLQLYTEMYGSTTVIIEKSCDHENTTDFPETAATCSEIGYTQGTLCNDCGRWASGHEEIVVYHTDANNDYICDVCFGEASLGYGTLNEKGTASFTLYVNGDLVISGTGSVDYDIDFYNSITINRIIIKEGITDLNSSFSMYGTTEPDISLLLPESLERIGQDFNTDFSVKSLYIPANVKEISSFSYDLSVTEKYIVSPDNECFSNDDFGALFNKDKTVMLAYPDEAPAQSYTIPEGVISLNPWLFYFADNLTSVTIPQSVRAIGIYAFNYNMRDSSYVEDNVRYIGDIAVSVPVNYVSEGGTITIKDGTRLICSNFYTAETVCDVHIPDSVLGIGAAAFSSVFIDTVHIPESVEYIDASAFYTKAYDVDENNRFYSNDEHGVLFNKEKTELIKYPSDETILTYTVPSSVKTIGANAFENASFRYISLPEGLETIEDSAFSHSELTALHIPDTVKTIGDCAIYSTNIEEIILPESVESIGRYALCDIQSVAVLNKDCVIENQDDPEFDDSFGFFYHYEKTKLIIGYDNSTAQTFAEENDRTFISLSGEHNHVYFPAMDVYPTCTEGGSKTYSCPCGNSQTYTANVNPISHEYRYDKTIGNYICLYCGALEYTFDCSCHCHSDEPIVKMFSTILRFFWKLFNISPVCTCGARHY